MLRFLYWSTAPTTTRSRHTKRATCAVGFLPTKRLPMWRANSTSETWNEKCLIFNFKTTISPIQRLHVNSQLCTIVTSWRTGWLALLSSCWEILVTSTLRWWSAWSLGSATTTSSEVRQSAGVVVIRLMLLSEGRNAAFGHWKSQRKRVYTFLLVATMFRWMQQVARDLNHKWICNIPEILHPQLDKTLNGT